MKPTLLLLMAMMVVGCSDPIDSTYDAKSDTVSCTEWHNASGTRSDWKESGYTCHDDPSQRVKPITQKEPTK